jgi:curved DNA-binding protein CbpA
MTSRGHPDPYVVLGVRRRASPEEIARAYRRAALATHPDGGGSGAGSERFRAVSDAYHVLRDPGRRAGYDRLHPPPRQQTDRATGGSVRYAAPGSQHVVLGSRAPSTAGRPTDGVGAGGEIEELFRVALSLLRRGW